jgi:2-dehydro-3-deoxyphosphogluconate aldolase/(4S)-4-hydroxy-2-oxoglutarate aldolase
MAALEKGLRTLKVLPSEVSAKNMADYLALQSVHAVGGSWMVEGKLIASGNFAEITRLAAEAAALAKQARP